MPVAQIITPNQDQTIYTGDAVFFSAYTENQTDWVYDWDYDGGAVAQKGHTPGTIVFSPAGEYTVTLTVTSGDEFATDSVKITVLKRIVPEDTSPEASIASPAGNISVHPGDSVTFKGNVSGGNLPYQYRWNFSGAAAESTLKDPGIVTFNMVGTYNVKFTVTDVDGDSDSDTVVVTVTEIDTSPSVSIVSPAADTTIFTNGSIVFDGESSGGNHPVTYKWDFGAGVPSSDLLDPGRVSFPNNGVFNVTLTATDFDEDTDTASVRVIVVNGTPALSDPPDNAAFDEKEVLLLQWNTITYAASYGIQIARDAQFADLVTDISSNANIYQVTGLTAGTYYWRVNATDSERNVSPWSSTRKFAITVSTEWYRVSCGYDHTLAIKATDRSLWAWGDNSRGQLGNEMIVESFVPVMIGEPEDEWEFVCAGHQASFGIKADGTLWAWGLNNHYQLGDGTCMDRYQPVLIGSVDDDWMYVSNRGDHTAALKSDGHLFMWGTGSNGQLGTGNPVAEITVPTQIGGDIWIQVEVGRMHTAGIKSDGSLWAWGANGSGQLGDGTLVERRIPTQVSAAGEIWTQVSTGWYFTLGIKDGKLYGTGDNFYGQIDLSPFTFRENFSQIGTDDNWAIVSAGYDHFLGIKQDGTLWGAGNNYDGQLLGAPSLAARYNLFLLSEDKDWNIVHTGYRHTMAITKSEIMYGAGLNDGGQVGVGSTEENIVVPLTINVPQED
jgi:alpha-tubulin suppressor-like RCC1 family protein